MKAAIDWIKWALKLGAEREEVGVSDKEAESFQKILTVLEAAEKVDKKDCLSFLDRPLWFIPDHPINSSYVYPRDQIRALLKSLPDKEPK